MPSFYGLEALRAAEGELPGFDELGTRAESGSSGRLGWPAPEHASDAIDEAEYDLALLGPLLDADPETTSGTAHYLLDSNPHLARALSGPLAQMAAAVDCRMTVWSMLINPRSKLSRSINLRRDHFRRPRFKTSPRVLIGFFFRRCTGFSLAKNRPRSK